jgi:ElaB/YqjD/DUF883 family membrane-anchored ribosome-binding protein
MDTDKDFERSGVNAAFGMKDSHRMEQLGERADRMAEEAARKAKELKDQASDVVGSAKERASETYDRTREALNRTYDRALDYGRQNPGSAILMGFGAGIGVGLLLAGNVASRRRSGLLPSVATSLADIVYEVFDRR